MPDDRTNDLGQPIGWPIDVVAPPVPASEPMVGIHCRLEPLDAAAHGSALFAEYTAAADDGDWTYLPYGPFEQEEELAAWLAAMAPLDDPMFFAVIDSATGAAVGVASFLRINPASASIEVGHIHFSRAMQKTPMATEAMHLMMKAAFEAGYRRYEWKCDALNAPSQAAARRLGFRYEGIFRQATHYKGRNRDTAWFGIIDSEWPALDAEFTRWLDPANFDADGSQRSPLTNRSAG